MKNIIKNFIVMPMLLLALVAGSFGMFVPNANAAISLESSFETLRAANHSDCPGCINWYAEGATHATADANSRPIVALGIAYKNNGSTTAQNVRVKLTPTSDSGSTNFTGRVWGSNTSVEIGNATVSIDSNEDIEFTGELYWYQNGSSNPTQISTSSGTLSNGYNLGSIPAGDYGGVVAHFEVTGEQVISYDLDVETLDAEDIEEDQAKLRGQVHAHGLSSDVWFEYSDDDNDLSTYGDGSLGAMTTSDHDFGAATYWLSHYRTVYGLNSNTTYYYQFCAENSQGDIDCDPQESFTTLGSSSNNEEVQTENASDVDEDSATLNGEVTEGNNVDVWFVIDDTSSISCSDNSIDVSVSGNYDQGQNFDAYVNNLQDNTMYYFRACSDNDSGNVLNFTTSDNGGSNFTDPDATTYNEDDVDEDSAELNGYIDMNSANNGIVFFVYGQDEDRIDDVENDYNEYSDVENDEDQDDFMTVEVDSDLDGSLSYSEDVYNLDNDEEYFFRICVEYDDEDNDENLECGSVKNFDTGSGNEDDPDVQTDNPSSVDEDSARLNGEYDMNDFDDGDIFFAWSDDEDDLDDVEDEDSLNDVDNFAEVEVVEYNADGSDSNVYETITGLDEDTTYYYRLCVLYEDEDNDDVIECGSVESFTTHDGFNPPNDDDRPIPGSCAASNLGITSATLSARVDGNGYTTSSYFQYGRTTSFGSNTTSSSTGSNTNIVSKFVSNLSPNTTYYCRIVSENTDGTSYGDIGTFRTRTLRVINPERPVTVVAGGSGSPIFLEIDDEQEVAARGQALQYDVRWENISGRDLEDVVLNVRLPKSVRFMSATQGRYNKRDHNVTVNIGELEAGEEDDMVIFATVRGGTEGDQLVAEATIAFEDPQSDTRGLLATIEYDVDTYTNGANGLLAGLFGVGLLPGLIGLLLAILLILIIVLVARRLTDPRRTEYRG